MKGFIFVLFLLISSSSYASISCSFKNFALNKLPSGVATVLECKNTPAIKEDISILLDKVGICKDSEDLLDLEKGFWGIFCKKYMPKLIDYSVDYVIPSRWECSANGLKEALDTIALQECDRI